MKNQKVYRSFLRAVSKHDAAAINDILVQHPEIHDRTGLEGGLVWILEMGAPELLESAFKAGLSPDSGVNLLQTFLQRAVSAGKKEWVSLALRYGANLEKRNSVGESALGYAIVCRQLDILRMLLDAGADVNGIETGEDGSKNTPLDLCNEWTEDREFARLLRNYGGKLYTEITA